MRGAHWEVSLKKKGKQEDARDNSTESQEEGPEHAGGRQGPGVALNTGQPCSRQPGEQRGIQAKKAKKGCLAHFMRSS